MEKSAKKFDPKITKHNIQKTENLCSHKYKIIFSETQHKILKGYFNECLNIYNLCVDIWKQYKDITTNWQILKDSIYNIVYKKQNSFENAIPLIISELKEKQKTYDIESELNQDKRKIQKQTEKNKKIKFKNKRIRERNT